MTETLKLSLHVVRRNWIVYRKDFLANISPSVADPVLLLLSLGLGLGTYIDQIDGLTYARFLAPGLIAASALFTAFFESAYGFYVRLVFENVYRAMLTTPIGVREVVLGEYIWLFCKGSVMSLGVSLILILFGALENPLAILWLPLLGGFIALPCGALGLIAAGYVRNINQFQIVYSFLIAPIYFLSGVFFPIQNPALIKLIQISPFYHGVRIMQMSAWNRIEWPTFFYHLAMLIAFTLVLSYWSIQKVRPKLQS